MLSPLDQVLNLVRFEAERLREAGMASPAMRVDGQAMRTLIRKAAWASLTASLGPASEIMETNNRAAICQASRFLERHCGACEQYDLSHKCPACGDQP